MSEVTDLVVIEKQNAMAVFTTKEQLWPKRRGLPMRQQLARLTSLIRSALTTKPRKILLKAESQKSLLEKPLSYWPDGRSETAQLITEATMNAYLTYDRIEDRRWVEQQLTDEKEKWIDDRAQQIIDMMPKEPSGLFHFSVPIDSSPYEGLRSDKAGEAYNDFISAVAYAQAEYDWEHRTGCPF